MNEKVIWDFIFGKTGNAYGTAALMGNLMAESSLNPKCVNGVKDAEQYIFDADTGVIDFVHDRKAFGLVQWCYWSRKEGLQRFSDEEGTSVGDLMTQLKYMWQELQKYKTAYNAIMEAKDIREASDVVMARYEKPANQSEAAKQKRAAYGQRYFDEFFGEKPKPEPAPAPTPSEKKTVVATKNVNIRYGNAPTYGKAGLLKEGSGLEWVATAENGWYAVKFEKYVCWVSNEFSKLVGSV